jgi:ATP/maltotriose-dependent transcriptional regulator MalT
LTSDRGPRLPLAAKLGPPRPEAPSIRAEQLASVAAATQARLLLVRAPAGYGKTTLIAAAAGELGWPCVWYRLDALDADPRQFLAALSRALEERLPGLDARLREAERGPADRPPAALAALLAGEVSRLARGELYLVLEDYEAVAGAAAFDAALGALLSYLPPSVRVVMLSRVRPAFPTEKLALDGQLAELGLDALRFDQGQAAAVAQRQGGAPPAHEAVEALLRLTEGWAAGVVLAAKGGWPDPPGRGESAAAGLEHAVFPYLAEQVYSRQGPEAQALLRRSCCLDSMTTALAEAVTGASDAGRLLAQLEADGAFTSMGPTAGTYRIHPLFRGFLQAQVAAEGGQAAVTGLQARTAAALAESGSAPSAVELYLSAGDPDATIRLLKEEGYRLLDECSQALLSRWAAALARKEQASGWATLLKGHQIYVSGDLDAARRRLEAALPLLSEDGSGRYLTLRALANCCYMAGADSAAVAFAREALQVSPAADRAEGLHALARMLSIACRWDEFDEAQARFAECEPVPAELAADMAMATIHRAYMTGDVRSALAAAERKMPMIRRDASRPMAVSLLHALAGLNIFACQYARGARFLDEARREADAHGHAQRRGHIDVTGAELVAQQGHLRECLALLADLLQEPVMQASGPMRYNVHMASAMALRRAGELGRAAQSYRLALESLESDGSAYERLDCQVELSFTEGLSGAHRHGAARLRLLQDQADAAGLRFQAAKAGFFLGMLALRAGDGDGEPGDIAPFGAELLRLGHLDFLGQELVADPEAAAWLRAESLSEEDLRELLRVAALQAGGPPLVASLVAGDERHLTLLLSLARTDLPERQAARLLGALRRHPSKEVRGKARRLDLGTAAAGTRLFLELTQREEEVLALLAEGCSNEQIARRLVLSVGTVKTHVHRILTKTGSSGRLAAAMLYRQRSGAPSGGDFSKAGEGKRSFTAAEVRAMSAAEYTSHREEIMAAMREGRYSE